MHCTAKTAFVGMGWRLTFAAGKLTKFATRTLPTNPNCMNKFYVIHGVHFANKYPQTCRAVACLPPKTMKIDIICASIHRDCNEIIAALCGRNGGATSDDRWSPLRPHLTSIRHPERSGETFLRVVSRKKQSPRSRTFLRRGRRKKASEWLADERGIYKEVLFKADAIQNVTFI